MASGFFLGGAAKGFEAQDPIGFYTQQKNEQFKQNMQQQAQVSGQIKQNMDYASSVIQSAIAAGQPASSAAKAIQPIIESTAQLADKGGVPGGGDRIRQIGTMLLSQPSIPTPQIPGVTDNQPNPQPTSPQPTSPADVPSGTPAPPGQNITGPNTTVTGVDYGPTSTSPPKPAATPTPDVNTWTRALLQLPPGAPQSQRDAIKLRLADAIKSQNGDDLDVKTLKDIGGGEHVVFVDKKNKKIYGPDGTPYVSPGDSDNPINDIAKAIEEGKQPPVTTGLYKNAAAVKAKLAKDGFDLSTANMQWTAAQKQVASLNGSQMVRYAGLAKSVINTIDEVNDLASKMELGGVPILNSSKLDAYAQLNGNSERGQLVARYQAAVNTLKEEFANLAQGGFAPTEAAWALANKQINGDYGYKQLGASLTEVQRLIRYRVQGIPNFQTLGPGAANPYVGSKDQQPAAVAASPPADSQRLKEKYGLK